ncbi:major facilitator superfamily domain-containing protein [Cladorrhinum samala]|uniref:Major facilitator superfamily domain-containing protein n=1 Tax=Cladorrhinum samala TaxID=585594 RepID=A0AAV9I558_9PEZI|nr:major facilitator superfamily domain-containing protein [Cladorrhinum samala]
METLLISNVQNNLRRWLAMAALACMWSNAQVPLYMFAGAPIHIYSSLHGAANWVWFVSANLLATAAIAPFVGALSDLFGRRYAALMGSMLVIIGQAVCGTAKEMWVFILGMAISGTGTGINELTALAGTAELVPVKQRGYYVAGLIITMLPFIPSVLYAQLIASTSSEGWRSISYVTGGWAFIGLIMTFCFYHPPPPRRARVANGGAAGEQEQGDRRNKREILGDMDFIGGVLSMLGLVAVEVGLLAGGYQSAQVLGPLILGILALALFGFWEWRWAGKPMIPRDMGKHPWTLGLTFIITFISGANFFSVLMLWPSQAYNVYGHDPVGVGIRGMPFAFGILGGCVISLFLLSWFRGNIKWILFGSSVLMTAGCGSLAAARLDNIKSVYAILLFAGLGVGGIVVPASMITTIICPSEVIATVTALTIAVRIVGGAIGYTIYYNVFVAKLVPLLTEIVGGACVQAGIHDVKIIGEIIGLTGESLLNEIRYLPGVNEKAWGEIVAAGQVAYSMAYPWVYYCSLVFGGVAVLSSFFLGDLSDVMNDTVAVVI